MTKSQLIRALARRGDVPHAMASRVVNLIFDQMRDALCEGRRVEIRGFGTFQVREYDGYRGRNPRTRSSIRVGSKSLPVFRAGKEIRERLNQRED
jgi:integration host factor subunit beta